MAAYCLGIRPPGDHLDHNHDDDDDYDDDGDHVDDDIDDYDDDGDNDDSNDYNDNDDKSQERLPHSCCYSTTKGNLFISFDHIMMISRPKKIETEKSNCLKIQAIFCKILPDQICAPLGARHSVGLADKT